VRGRRSAWALCVVGSLVLMGARCLPGPLLPATVAISPAPGATIARTAWLQVDFASSVSLASLGNVLLGCNDQAVPAALHLLDPDTLVIQPVGPMPAGSPCNLVLHTVSGRVGVPFQTAALGTPFTAIYDRRDPDQPLPFPDDFFLTPDASTETGWRPAVVTPTHPGTTSLLLQVLANAAASSTDGWSPIGDIAVQLSAAPDPGSLPLDADAAADPLSTVALLDLAPGSPTYGQRVPFVLTPRSDALPGEPVAYDLVIFPSIPLEPQGTYGLVVTDRVLDASGEPLARSAFFDAAVGPPLPGEDAAITDLRPLANEVLDAAQALAPLPIPRDDVVLATRISVRSVDHFPDDVLAMRDDAFATPPNVTISSVQADADPDVAAIVRGTFDAPVWRNGAFVTRDAAGLPVQIGTQSIDFILALPAAAASAGHAPIVMYQHGNPGSAQAEVPGSARSFLGQAGFAVGGFTDVLNRMYATVDDQTFAIFGVVLVSGLPPDFYIQTYGEQLAFLHALQSLGSLDVLPLGAPDGVPDVDPTSIVYEGISYGSVHGQAFLAYAPEILAGGLVAGASRLVELLEYQDRTLPLGGQRFLTEILPSVLSGVRAPDTFMGLALFATNYDRQDPHNHARFFFRDPVQVNGTTLKPSLLVVEGIDDNFTKNNTTRSLAWQLGPIPQLAPGVVRVATLPLASAPIQANVDAQTTAAFVQFTPAGVPGLPPTPGCESQFEGHYCAQTAPSSRAMRVLFYQSALVGPPLVQ
jgi:hypothetical protein